MATEATRQQSVHYGCIVQDRDTSEVTHYVEKPSTFVSTLINCGVYVCSIDIFQTFAGVFNARQQEYYKSVFSEYYKNIIKAYYFIYFRGVLRLKFYLYVQIT